MPEVDCGFDDRQLGSALLAHYGPALRVNIGFDPAFTPDSNSPPTPGISYVEALVDTGADVSCIDSQLAAQLNLPIVDQRPVCGVTGIRAVNMYLAQVHVPALRFTQYGMFAGVDLKAGGQRHAALIGRTFLQHFRMLYDGTSGIVKISRD